MIRLLFAVLMAGLSAFSQDPDPRELYQSLNAIRVDRAQIYYVREVNLRSEAARLVLNEGKLALLAEHNGQVTGAVFSGTGRVLAIPRDPIEKGSIARALGVPLVDLEFTRAYFRFNDATAEDLKTQLRNAGAMPVPDPAFATEWDLTVANLNPWHSLRILTDRLSAAPMPYFYAGLVTPTRGPMEVLYDPRREESALIGQTLTAEGRSRYDVWASFEAGPPRENMGVATTVSLAVDTTIQPNGALAGKATLRMRATRSGERVVPLQLSKSLTLRSATDAAGRPLPFLQMDEPNRFDFALRGDQMAYVVLAEGTQAGDDVTLQLTYEGKPLTSTGNNSFVAGEQGSWYPRLAGPREFALYDLTFRWPHTMRLAATGTPVAESEEGEWRAGRWQTPKPVPGAGFHLGEFRVESVETGGKRVEVYGRAESGNASRELAASIADSISFLEKLNGAFPFERLAVTPASGDLGQGWPGLASVRSGGTRLNLPAGLVPFHEVARQWWGASVGSATYRDEWIQEGLAQYLALLYGESKRQAQLAAWLARARDDLAKKPANSEDSAADAGSLAIGPRLRASRVPGAYETVTYGKGPWIFHMLRMMLREPAAAEPDARFAQLLRSLVETHRQKPLSNVDLKRAVEAVMTKSMDLEGDKKMDWFFDQWVYGTGIPRYKVEFTVKPQGQNFIVSGKVVQNEVPDWFTAAVPLYVAGTNTLLGTVITDGPETEFQFTTRTRPAKIALDPNLTVLCVVE